MSRFALKNTSFSSRWTVTGVGTKRIVQKRSSLWKPSKSTPENNEASDSDASEMRMDEDMIAKLRKAEEESERLKREVATLRVTARPSLVPLWLDLGRGTGESWKDVLESSSHRLQRFETRNHPSNEYSEEEIDRIFEFCCPDDKNGNWLSETDVEFLTGSGEEAVSGLSPEEQAIVNVRPSFLLSKTTFLASFGNRWRICSLFRRFCFHSYRVF